MIMLPGEVQSDEQAFRQILGRLEGEVGTTIGLIVEGKQKGLFPGTAPYWALMRMMFPIAESLGDLIYQTSSTAANLQSVLENELETVRTGYKCKAAILTMLYRHSLTHHDELRVLETRTKKIFWVVSIGGPTDHLKVSRPASDVVSIQFDTTAFYSDLVTVCREMIAKQWGGQVMMRYNGWLTLDLEKKEVKERSKTEKAAIREIGSL
jgi:hypothetical protein